MFSCYEYSVCKLRLKYAYSLIVDHRYLLLIALLALNDSNSGLYSIPIRTKSREVKCAKVTKDIFHQKNVEACTGTDHGGISVLSSVIPTNLSRFCNREFPV